MLPSMWFGAPLELTIRGNTNFEVLILSVMALIIPLVLILTYTIYIGYNFENNLSKMHSSEKVNKKSKVFKERRLRKLASLLCKNREEKESFIFTTNMISKERSLKLRIYPSIAMGIAFPMFFTVLEFKEYGSLQKAYDNSFGGYSFLWIYFSVMFLNCSAGYIGNSDSYKGAWIYTVLPIKDTSSIKKGSIKAALYKLIVIPYMIMSAIYLYFGKANVVIDLLIVFNMIIVCYCIWFKMVGAKMPFSESYEALEQSKNVGPTMVILFISIILAVIHAFVFKAYILIKLGYLALATISMMFMWRKLLK